MNRIEVYQENLEIRLDEVNNMNKEEILNRSKIENKCGDERDLLIEKNASKNAMTVVSAVTMIMGLITLLNHNIFGDPYLFFFITSLAFSIQNGTLYYYKKDSQTLVNAIISMILAILLLLRASDILVINIFDLW